MRSSSRSFFSALLAFFQLTATTVAAAPPLADDTPKLATYRARNVGSTKYQSFHPEASYETFDGPVDHPYSKREDFNLENAARVFAASHFDFSMDMLNKHTIISNTAANVAFDNDNKVVAIGSTLVKDLEFVSSTPSISEDTAIAKAEEIFGIKHNGHPTSIEYVVMGDNTAKLAFVVQIQNEDEGVWQEVFVDAHSKEVITLTDFSADASYLALPLNEQDPAGGFKTIEDPQDTTASPHGWHSNGKTSFQTTSGNNAVSYKGKERNVTAESSQTLVFDYKPNFKLDPKTTTNVNAARVNAFYVVNSVHDFSYRYGFTERAFNFQTNNFGKGGKGKDRVHISVQDHRGVNNAQFLTPPDGQSGQMRMFIWDETKIRRDGTFENDIVVHENTHGITNRMTGGGTGRCLQTIESGGLGEGWSDAMADWTEQNSTQIRDYVVGAYVINLRHGIRKYPYSTNSKTNPLRYANIKNMDEVHEIGEVWANILHNMLAALVKSYGWSSIARTNPDGPEGNIVWLHLFIDGLSLQPCNPTFIAARDAWIQADKLRYKGVNKCLLWKVFASRGMGLKAKHYKNDYSIPRSCYNRYTNL